MTQLALTIIVRASALLSVAALTDLVLRRAPAATRHLVWTLAIGALLALPIASTVLPAWTVSIPIAPPVAAPVVSTTTTMSNVVVAPEAASPAMAQTASPRVSAIAAVYVLYAAGIVVLLVRLLLESVAVRRLTRTSTNVSDTAWCALLDEAATQLGVAKNVRLLRNQRDVMPMTFGSIAPTIVLPASADEWTDERRRAVLLHELAHVARRDCLVQRFAAVACALYWPHPGVWWAAKRLRTERELACDDRVLNSGAVARDYAGHLLEIAHTFRAAPAPATALGMARARQLERRLLAILDEARNRAALGRLRGGILVAVAIAVFVPMAAVRAALLPIEVAPQAASKTRARASDAQEFTGTWDMHLTRDPGQVQLNIRRGESMHGRTMPLADLERLAGTTLASASTVHFPIRREAGTFTIDGTCRNSTCGGTFIFEPSATFGAELAKRGIGRPTAQDQFYLAISDIGTAYLDTLAAAGYATPDLQTLIKAGQHGVDAVYVKDMAALGYRLGTLDPLIHLRDHGVDPAYVRGMAASGMPKLSADDLVTARDHGVDPEYVRAMQGLGQKLTIDGFRRTRDHGVDPEYVRQLASLGYGELTDEALVKARDHGVDPEYVRAMAALGYKGTPLDSLIRMRDHGVDPTYVRQLQARGMSNLSVDEIIRRRDRGDDR
jgi:beta-lactamase regulating signal transducer with metallopeptidase domain